ncbi:MAG: hypothetical protein K9J30_04280 [Bacteroidales bacterium]|nr:hypothetical protein [Bacteroidales bacterium]
MRRTILIILILFVSLLSHAQRSKVLAVFQLIESEKFKEAKEAVEEAVKDEKTWKWPRTWYARGLLCQEAYQKGIKENDKSMYELYPNQLYVAYESYDKALKYDRGGRLDDQIAARMVLLANDILKVGEKKYAAGEYSSALKAFEHVIMINENPVLSLQTDANLIYNTALAAYRSGSWDVALEYLNLLEAGNFSSNVTHLLYSVQMAKGDSLAAERTLIAGIRKYRGDNNLVLMLVDLLLRDNKSEKAVHLLDSVAAIDTGNYIYAYAKGLVHQHTEDYYPAIDAYKEAIQLAPDTAALYANTGVCYYNAGIEIQDHARTISNNSEYVREKARSEEAFISAVEWLEMAVKKNSRDENVVELLQQLYSMLHMNKEVP